MSDRPEELRPAEGITARSKAVRTLLTSQRAALSLAALALATVVIGFGFRSYPKVEAVVRDQVRSELVATRDASATAVAEWLGDAQRVAALTLTDTRLVEALRRCASDPPPCQAADVGALLHAYQQTGGFLRYLVVDRAGRVRAGDTDRNNPETLPADVSRSLATLGERVELLPPRFDAARPVLWVAVPIPARTAGTSALGVLLLQLPLDRLGEVLRIARTGQTGETYAFDATGRLLSQSRFEGQLKRAGLLSPRAESALLDVELRDPGVDLTRGGHARLPRTEQPLTRMAHDAVRGGAGVDLAGYRDYRGVPVVGAWRWLPEFRVGVASEVDHDEAFLAMSTLRSVFHGLLGALGVASFALVSIAFATARFRSRARRAERLAAEYGQYRIVRKLGEGGMGVVYLATHRMLRRPAALKLLKEGRAGEDAEFHPSGCSAAARFDREVLITSELSHPNTVAVYDYGRTDGGTPYYVMEYVEGVDLQRLVERFGPLPSERVIHVLRQLCGSLAEAHTAGLVHRDIKPANLMLCSKKGAADTVKVLDFGVVKSLRDGGGEHRVLIGTPDYMAPELFESSASADAQSDLYAVGCVAYFLLTGRTLFDGASTTEISAAHLTRAAPAPSLRTSAPVDPVLENAVMACLAKRKEARPRSATALRTLLDRSTVAHAWTQPRADRWWTEHAPPTAPPAQEAPHTVSVERTGFERPVSNRPQR